MSQALRYPRPASLADLGTRHAVVEASAGTGKTFLLENLVVDLLLRRGAKLEQILVVTFTERATSELCLRLRKKLSAMLHAGPDDPEVQKASALPGQDCWILDAAARERLRDALLAFDRATISTFHGFCRGILAEHAFLNGRLFDEQAVDEESSFHSAFVEALRQDFSVDPALRPMLAAWLEQGNSEGLEGILLACSRELARVFPPDPAALRPAFDETALHAALAMWPRDLACDDTLGARLKRQGIKSPSTNPVLDRLETLNRLIDERRDETPTFLAKLERLEATSKWKDRGFGYLIDQLSLASHDATILRLRDAVTALHRARVPLLAALVPKFLPRVQARLQARKRRAGHYDFQDMLTLVAQRLSEDSASARLLLSTLRQRYRHALIDEFQDTDDIQWFIFRRLFFESREGHALTVIGDPKQAIYRFRGADVHTYLRARQEIVGAGGAQLRLGQNFRSTPAVVNGCNALFAEATGFFRPGTGIDYRQPVTCARPERGLWDAEQRPQPGVVVFDLGQEGKAGEVRTALRRQMVEEIQRLIGPQGQLFVQGQDGPRALHAGDIFVLTFSHKEGLEVGQSLREAGIAHAFFRQNELFATPEAADILDLLRALVDPRDARLRARALLTKFFALDLPDLPQVNRVDGASPALDHLFAWQRLAQDGDFGALFASIVSRSGVACREVALASSERSLTNTLHIFEILQDQAASSRADLRELVEMLGGYINGTRKPPGQDRDVQRLESEAKAVQIMTVHASKGLEAEVVFLYGGVERDNKDEKPYVFPDGQGRRVVHLGELNDVEEAQGRQEHDDEDRRLLYVALTRARARLYVPRYPDGKSGRGAGLTSILDQVLASPGAHTLFHKVAVACPGAPPPRRPEPEPAALARWQPPPAPTLPSEEFRQIAHKRAGFFITSYTGVKRRHGGFVVAEGPAETGTPVVDVRPAPAVAGELERGRLSGIFLHALLEELPLDLAADLDAEAWLSHPELSRLFDRLARQHERQPRQLAHAARMVQAALFSPLRLGAHLCPGVGRQRPILRETEFLFPIPEDSHPLLGREPDGRPWPIERGLVKGFIDVLFEHEGRLFLGDWKGDSLPAWDKDTLDQHCQNNYDVQARLYTLAVLRLAGVHERASYEDRFGGILYCFLRGLRPDEPEAGIMFRRPAWDTVLAWQNEMLSGEFWGLS